MRQDYQTEGYRNGTINMFPPTQHNVQPPKATYLQIQNSGMGESQMIVKQGYMMQGDKAYKLPNPYLNWTVLHS